MTDAINTATAPIGTLIAALKAGYFNSDGYSVSVNPGGLMGRHDLTFPAALVGVARLVEQTGTDAAATAADRSAVALDRQAVAPSVSAAASSAGASERAQGLAEAARDKAQAWSEGTSPGGPGTKSAREHAADAAASAASISGGPVASVDGATGVVVTASASETVAGRIEIATQAEVTAGADNVRAVTPLKLAAWPAAIGSVAPAVGDKLVLADVSAGGVPKTALVSDILALAGGSIIRSPRTANTALGVADKGALIDVTSGTWTQTLTAAATLGSGWYCYIGNSGSGVVTLDPNGAETIGWVATATLRPGDFWLIQCDGSAFRLQRLAGRTLVVLTSGTSYTVEAGVYRLYAEAWGAGAAGGYSGNSSPTNGQGGAGAYSAGWLDVVPGQTITYSVGAGGVGHTTNNGNGPAGGSTTFGPLTAGGAPTAAYNGNINAGGTASGGTINLNGGPGINVSGGAAIAGTSPFSGAGGANDGSSHVTSPSIPGGGGASGSTAHGASQSGARGEIHVSFT